VPRASRKWPSSAESAPGRAPPRRTLLVGQSGGPTAVINASLAGVIAEAQRQQKSGHGFDHVLGLRHGVQGILDARPGSGLVDLTGLDAATLERLRCTPSAALGSCRYKLRPGDVDRLLELCRAEAVGAFVYIGGNDSADTAHQVAGAAPAAGLPDLRVLAVPKTIDNDLPATDHCPGYGSAARFLAQTTREAALDTWAMRRTDPIKLVEVMGRHAGWLAAAGWLARSAADDAPHLVYVPERPRPVERIVADVGSVYQRLGWCVVVLCENQPDPTGAVIGARGEPRWVDAFGHAYYDSPAAWLARELQAALRVRVRIDKPGTIQRMATAYVSPVDRAEAELVGRAAVRGAGEGLSDVMVTLERRSEARYAVGTGTAPLAVVANEQRRLPPAFVNEDGNGLTAAFESYARPLIGGPLPEFVRFG
jgi:ATP-dependent phosphofructokinase / diphosphate-dependent phosphofructokinase